ncbi:hypothetical protein LguiA_005071 [Lonicera macranthoides]
MARWWFWGKRGGYELLCGCKEGFIYQSKRGLVNVKLKWVKDRVLDGVMSGERDLKAACILVSIISSVPDCCLPVYHLSSHRGQLGLPHDLKISTFIRSYPTIFDEFHVPDSGGTRVPWFRLTPESLSLHRDELSVVEDCKTDLLNRLRKLLMLTKDGMLPLQTIDQLKWDLGLQHDYQSSFVPQYPDLFSLVRLPDDRAGLKHLLWDDGLAVSHFEKSRRQEGDVENGNSAFQIGFTRGFGLKRKCIEWLNEWQRLPYTNPYSNPFHLDPRTDISEKRMVGVFHELLHLTIQKKTERQNVSNLRKPLALPQKFTKVFERHPGIFYISKKCDTQTVVLREAYDRDKLFERHPLVDIRERYANLMKKGLLDRSNGLYKKKKGAHLEDGGGPLMNNVSGGRLDGSRFNSEGESDYEFLSEYESDEAFDNSCQILGNS